MFDVNTLKPRSEFSYLEKTVKLPIVCPEVTAFLCNDGSYRFVHVDEIQDDRKYPFNCALLIDKTHVITSVYTKPRARRKKIAKQLLLVARLTLGTVYHSDNLTSSGKLWRDSVEAV